MKKFNLLIGLVLIASQINAQNMLTNGGFESYNNLPTTCPTLPSSSASTLSDLNNWSGVTTNFYWDGIANCIAGTCSNTVVYARSYYYNSTTGGNGGCEPITAHSGTGYLIAQNHGVNPAGSNCTNGANQYIYQSLSGTTLYASNNYSFQGYVYLGNVFATSLLTAKLTTGTTIPNGTGVSISVTGSGWVAFSVTLTVPSNGSNYNLVIGPSTSCTPMTTYFYYAFDDLSLTQTPCVGDAGANQTNTPQCCGSPCPGVGVQIGTSGLSGLTYSWTCSADPNCYISSTTSPTPTVSPCSAPSTTIYSVTVQGPGCITATYTMSVATHTVTNCCRLANPNDPGTVDGVNKVHHFTLFPNPAKDAVTLSLNNPLDHLKIVDASGKTVYEAKALATGDLKIDLSHFAKGIYFVIGKAGEDIEKQKFIVE